MFVSVEDSIHISSINRPSKPLTALKQVLYTRGNMLGQSDQLSVTLISKTRVHNDPYNKTQTHAHC